MTKVKELLDQEYPESKRESVTNLDIRSENLEGELVIENWPNLERLDCGFNQITSIKISNLPKLSFFSARNCQLSSLSINNCPEISNLNVKKNFLFSSDFIASLNSEKLTFFDAGNNDSFPSQDLSIFSHLINLKELYFGNNFQGSLEPLKSLTSLKSLGIFTPKVESGLEYLTTSLEKIYLHSKKEENKSLKIWEELKDYPTKDKHEFLCYDYSAWRRDNNERIELANIDKLTLLRQFRLLEQEKKEMQENIEKMQREMTNLEKKLLQNNSPIIITNNLSNTNSAYFNNQVYFQYNQELANRELAKLEKEYRKLESSDNELPSDPQKLKKTILFLEAKRIFAARRQSTIKSLIKTYEDLDKSNKKHEKIITVGDYVSATGDMVSSFPPASITLKLLGKGIPVITNFFKGRSLTRHTEKFEDRLLEDEKSLTLLQETYQSLYNSLQSNQSKMNPVLVKLLRQNKFSEYSVFIISEIPRGTADLKAENMKKAIESLDKHFVEFKQELQQEEDQQTKELEKLFSTEDSSSLQAEVIKLLEILQKKLLGEINNEEDLTRNQNDLSKKIKSKETHFKSSISAVNSKLEVKGLPLFNKKDKIKERKLLFEIFLGGTRELTTLERKELIIKDELTWEDLDKIKQIQVELRDLESLQKQQSQVQIPPK